MRADTPSDKLIVQTHFLGQVKLVSIVIKCKYAGNQYKKYNATGSLVAETINFIWQAVDGSRDMLVIHPS